MVFNNFSCFAFLVGRLNTEEAATSIIENWITFYVKSANEALCT